MSKIAVFLAVGFEEIEAINTIDVLRRGGMEVDLISVSGSLDVQGAHGVSVKCDLIFYNVDYSYYDALILPGGQPGTDNLNKHEGLLALIPEFISEGKKVAAICAAPMILGGLGLLEGKEATCYPGIDPHLTGATVLRDPVVKSSDQIITGKGPGASIDFGLEILKWFIPEEDVASLREALMMSC